MQAFHFHFALQPWRDWGAHETDLPAHRCLSARTFALFPIALTLFPPTHLGFPSRGFVPTRFRQFFVNLINEVDSSASSVSSPVPRVRISMAPPISVRGDRHRSLRSHATTRSRSLRVLTHTTPIPSLAPFARFIRSDPRSHCSRPRTVNIVCLGTLG